MWHSYIFRTACIYLAHCWIRVCFESLGQYGLSQGQIGLNKYGVGQSAEAKIISNADQTLNCNFGLFPNSTCIICILSCCFLLPGNIGQQSRLARIRFRRISVSPTKLFREEK